MRQVSGVEDFRREVLEADGPVVVDFGAEWCRPCVMVAPVLTELGEELGVRVVRVDTDVDQELARAYDVRQIPTLHLFEGGSLRRTLVGAWPKRDIRDWISAGAPGRATLGG